MEYDNNMSGVLFKNEDKREGHKDADYRGNAEVDGVQYWLNAWVNESQDGTKKFMKIRFKPKEKKQGEPKQKVAGKMTDDEIDGMNDEIPF